MNHQITNMPTIEYLLKQLKIKLTKRYLQELYDLEPYKKSLFGISNILSEYKIKTTGFRIKEKDDFQAISSPAIANIYNQFVIISEVATDNIVFWQNGETKSITVDEFFIRSNGIVLTCEVDDKSIEPDYIEHKKAELFSIFRNGSIYTSLILLSVFGIVLNETYTYIETFILLILNIVGGYTGYLLLQKQMNIQNEQADKVCSLIKKGDCNTVLFSPASKWMGMIGWSEIGLGYFIAGLFIILFIPSLIPCLGIISCCALPYTIWSVWYQKFKVKQWCTLCLIVQLLHWLLFATYLMSGDIYISQLFIPKFFVVGSIFVISILSINMLIPYFVEKKNLRMVLEKYKGLKINEDVFRAKLTAQRQYSIDTNTSNILFGNKDAKNLITVISNPHCAPCAMMHERINHLMDRMKHKICIQYIFSAFSPEFQSSSNFLTAVYLSDDISMENKHKIYDEWFEEGRLNAKSFFEKYNISCQTPQVEAESQKHTDWKIKTGITGTPTILFNGYKLPDEYGIEDLMYFTDLEIEK